MNSRLGGGESARACGATAPKAAPGLNSPGLAIQLAEVYATWPLNRGTWPGPAAEEASHTVCTLLSTQPMAPWRELGLQAA